MDILINKIETWKSLTKSFKDIFDTYLPDSKLSEEDKIILNHYLSDRHKLEDEIRLELNNYFILNVNLGKTFGEWYTGMLDDKTGKYSSLSNSITVGIPYIEKPLYFNSYVTLYAVLNEESIDTFTKPSYITLRSEASKFYDLLENFNQESINSFVHLENKENNNIMSFIERAKKKFSINYENVINNGLSYNLPNVDKKINITRQDPLCRKFKSDILKVIENVQMALITGKEPENMYIIDRGSWDNIYSNLSKILLKENLAKDLKVTNLESLVTKL